MSSNANPQQQLVLEGAQQSPDWSKAIPFAPGQPAVLPMICQHISTGQVLMLGYVSKESLAETLRSGQVVFWSRSRNALWKKGETSGNVLNVRRVLLDCDGDSFLALVEPQGPTCHRHTTTCFDEQNVKSGESDFIETDVGWSVVARLFETLQRRAGGEDPDSYTYKLLQAGLDRVLRKLGEECTETILAAKNHTITADKNEFAEESADLLYHWMVALLAVGQTPADVFKVLRAREGGPRRVAVPKV